VKLGFIGLGKMGKPMTLNLLKAGHEVTVHNRSRAVVDELGGQGANRATSPAQVAAAADIVMTCLPTPASVEEGYSGANGLLPAARTGQLFIDFSTVAVALSRSLAVGATAKGAAFLDAPVSGGPAGAQGGALTIMVGGEKAAFDQALPVFQALGKNIHHLGPSGAGTVIKLVNQLLVCINMAGVVEGLMLGAKAGADPQVVMDVIGNSFGGSFMLNRAVPLLQQRKFEPGTPVNLILKDQGIIHEMAGELGVRLLMGSQARAIFEEARALGLGDQDMVSLMIPQERIAGQEVTRAVGG